MISLSIIKLGVARFFKKFRKVFFFVVLAGVVLPDVAVYFHKQNRGHDINGYISAGKDALNLENLYRISAPGKNNTWPPFFSFFSIPLAISQNLLGLPVTKELWYLVNFISFIATMQIISLLLYKKKASFFPDNSGFDFTSDLIFVPFFLILPGFVYNFFMLQINMLVLFLAIAGYYLHTKEKDWSAGFFFGLAAAIKAYPGLFLIYFLLRKQWKVAGSTILWGIGFTILPVLFYGFEGYCNLMMEWISISFLKPFIIGYQSWNNQSLYAFWERLLAHQLHITEPASVIIKTANYSSIIAISITVFSFLLRSPYRKSSVSGFIEFSAVCIMMMLFPPIAWRHYWVLLLPATASVYYCLRKIPQDVSAPVKYLFTTYIILIGIPYLASKSAIAVFLKMNSNYTFSALVLLAALIILHRKINLQQNTLSCSSSQC